MALVTSIHMNQLYSVACCKDLKQLGVQMIPLILSFTQIKVLLIIIAQFSECIYAIQ